MKIFLRKCSFSPVLSKNHVLARRQRTLPHSGVNKATATAVILRGELIKI